VVNATKIKGWATRPTIRPTKSEQYLKEDGTVTYTATRGLTTVLLVAVTAAGAAQCGPVDRESPEAVKNEVNRLFNKSLDAMESTLPSGTKVTSWIPPDDSVHDQIKCLGAAAVPATADLLHNTRRSFGHILAIRMLGWEGGPEIIPPLAEILAKPTDPLKLDSVKFEALQSLFAAPPTKALPLVEQVLQSEKNPDLLRAAARVKAKLSGTAD
jgi:HEAT repeat protein